MIELRNIKTGKKILIKKVFCNDVKNPKACYIRTKYWSPLMFESTEPKDYIVRKQLHSERAGRLIYYGQVTKKVGGVKAEFSSFSIPEGWEIIPETATKIKMR